MLSASLVAEYLRSYVESYRKEYDRLTSNLPTGANYPRIPISPYLDAPILTAYVGSDGVAIAVFEDLPGGPRPAVAGIATDADVPLSGCAVH